MMKHGTSKFALLIDRDFFEGDRDLLKEAKGGVDPASAATRKPRDGLGCVGTCSEDHVELWGFE